ncbi:hypothetical protein AB0A70_11380 [Streptomyces morookaense]|uniref:hypothetical protein n=1 Tax=Streptomyces morookaense TaxID=1970 RepID=UPI0033CBA465
MALTFLWLFLTALAGVMGVALVLHVSRFGSTVSLVFRGSYAVLAVGMAYSSIRAIRRSDTSDAPASRDRRRATGRGARTGTAAALGSTVAQAFVILAVPAVFGYFLPLLIRSFGRYWLGERQARRLSGLDT